MFFPRVDLEAPILKGASTFENWEDADAAIRACVEGQFLNMKLRTDWMQLKPEVVYLTGGASKNNAIAQVIAPRIPTTWKTFTDCDIDNTDIPGTWMKAISEINVNSIINSCGELHDETGFREIIRRHGIIL